MNGPGDIPTTNGTVPEQHCGPLGFLPSFGMSCRGRAEAFARRLQSRLRTLGSQAGDDDSPTADEEPIINSTENTWLSQDGHQQGVTSLQPLRHMSHEADSFFDFDCEPESPGSPADECEYSRLIETASVTPQNDAAPESGYICASPITPENASQASHSSSDGPFFDPEASENEDRSLPTDYYDCVESKRDSGISVAINGHDESEGQNHKEEFFQNDQLHTIQNDSSDSLSESLPPSQDSTSTNATSTTQSSFTFTGANSSSNSTLQDIVLAELQEQSAKQTVKLQNGYPEEHADTTDEGQNDHTEAEASLMNELSQELKKEEETTQIVEEQSNVPQNTPKEGDTGLKIDIVEANNASLTADSQENAQFEGENSTEKQSEGQKQLSTCDTDDDDDCRPQRVRRCSSLKTGKTPPGTPGRKKIVRFADVLGLDLADVKTFLDEIPTIPKSAYEDLDVIDPIEQPIQLGPRLEKILMPLFQQPGGLPNFLDMVREMQVCLENAAVTDTINLTITGSVRVRNLDFHKSVHVRYTLDNWRSFADLQANYVQNSCDGFSDKFSFVLFGNSMSIGQRLQFAVRFQCKGQQFWDSNHGANYCFQCLPVTSNTTPHRPIIPHHHASSILSPVDTWCSGSFY